MPLVSRTLWLAAVVAGIGVVGVTLGGSGCSTGSEASGASTTLTIGASGGTLTLGALSVEIPPGALAEPRSITLRRVVDAAPPGYLAASDVVRLEPDGLALARPATLRIALDARSEVARNDVGFVWSSQALPTALFGERAVAELTRFGGSGCLAVPTCKHGSACETEGAVCAYFETTCHRDPIERRHDFTCTGGKWTRHEPQERSCHPNDGGVDAGTDGSVPPDASRDAGTDAPGACVPGEAGCVLTSDAGVVTLVPTDSNPMHVAVDVDYVYWANGNAQGLRRVPINGGTPTILAATSAYGAVAVDATHVYWADQTKGLVSKVAKGGGTPIPLAGPTINGQPNQPTGIALDETTVYWTSPYGPTAGTIMSVSKGGGAPFTIAAGQAHPEFGIAVDATHVYWTNHGSNELGYADSAVMKAPKTGVPEGSTPTTLAALPDAFAPQGLAVDATSVYWVNSNGTVMKVPLAGGVPTALATNQSPAPWGLAIDATHVYWTNEGTPENIGAVKKVPKCGGCVTTLAERVNNLGLTVDASHVYWVWQNTGVGSVGKVPKN